MKKIGKQVLYLPVSDENPRNGESTFIRLKDDSILFAYTYYYGDGCDDDCTARIAYCRSFDEGETWTKPETLFPKDPGAKNNMSPSLVRLKDGNLGIVYLRKEKHANGAVTCMPVFRKSADEGRTWSDFRFIGMPEGYYCAINDGAVMLKSGRLVVPMSDCGDGLKYFDGVIRYAYSDDSGATWAQLEGYVKSPYQKDGIGLQEPGLYEFEDGTLWSYFRTSYGFQYDAYSSDGGRSWSTAAPNFHFTSTEAPMRVKKVGDLTVAVFNPFPYHYLRSEIEIRRWGRTPMVCAVSTDDGKSFDSRGKAANAGEMQAFAKNIYCLEDDRTEAFCYPSILETKDGFLVSYYCSGPYEFILRNTKIVKVTLDELKQA